MKTTENEIWNIDDTIPCPVCERIVQLFEICVCGWENTGETNIDGGPNKLTLEEAIRQYKMTRHVY